MARQCVVCGKEFFHSKLRKVTCSNKCMNKWNYQQHTDNILSYQKGYYAKNKEHKKEYCDTHNARITAYAKAYRETHKEQLRIKARKYRKKKNDIHQTKKGIM